MINRINSKSDSFYTSVGGKTAHVGVVNGANGPYVQTHADGSWNNNLLSLSECA